MIGFTDVKNEFKKVVSAASLFAPTTEGLTCQATLYTGDIRQPWKSVHGFAITAARLAAYQKLRLHCREDEVFELMAKLNHLLEYPENLNRVVEWLELLEREHRQRLAQLIALESQSASENEVDPLLEDVEQFTAESAQPTVVSPLKEALFRHDPQAKIPGLLEMLNQLQVWLTALEKIKHCGFHVIAYDRHRQLARPALEAQRNEPIWWNGQPTTLPAGFLQPAKHHLTLWAYLVARSDQGQSTIWN